MLSVGQIGLSKKVPFAEEIVEVGCSKDALKDRVHEACVANILETNYVLGHLRLFCPTHIDVRVLLRISCTARTIISRGKGSCGGLRTHLRLR